MPRPTQPYGIRLRQTVLRSVASNLYHRCCVTGTRFRSSLSQLDRGEPITAIGIGSSVMSGHAGCFYDRRSRVEGMVARLQSGSAAGTVPLVCPADGWLGMPFRELNRTWPHPGHVFLNLGHGGARHRRARAVRLEAMRRAALLSYLIFASRCAGVLLHSFANHWCSAGLIPEHTPVRRRSAQRSAFPCVSLSLC